MLLKPLETMDTILSRSEVFKEVNIDVNISESNGVKRPRSLLANSTISTLTLRPFTLFLAVTSSPSLPKFSIMTDDCNCVLIRDSRSALELFKIIIFATLSFSNDNDSFSVSSNGNDNGNDNDNDNGIDNDNDND